MNNFYLGKFRKLLLALAIASLAVIPIGQAIAQVALPYGASISQATAEKMTAVGVGYGIKQKMALGLPESSRGHHGDRRCADHRGRRNHWWSIRLCLGG
jgi:hypothetical protein